MDNNQRNKESKTEPVKDVVKLQSKKKNLRKDLSKSKRAKYTSVSLSANQVFRDLKISASKHISNVKSHLDSILSQKLRLTSNKDGNKKYCYSEDDLWYAEFENEPRTPIKMYSPFGIETPSPSNKAEIVQTKRKARPFQSRINQPLVFASPTGKIKDDVKSITNSLNELSLMTASIQSRCSAKNLNEKIEKASEEQENDLLLL